MFISAIIPNYNHALYLQQRIDSVLQQNRKPDEIIILDDCSTDNSVAIIKAIVAAHPSIQFIRNTQNSGNTFKQWNKGVALATGDYVWMAESDDVAAPGFLAALEQALLLNPIAVLAYCQSDRLNSVDQITGTWQTFTDSMAGGQIFHVDFKMDGRNYIEQYLIHQNTIPNASAVLFSKKAFEEVGGADTSLKTNGDWLLWLRIAQRGGIAFVSKTYNQFRYHNASVIAQAHASNTDVYKEKYDGTMRQLFSRHLNSSNDKAIIALNRNYISIDSGQKGLHYLQLHQWTKGWYWILKGSIYAGIKTGFIKKALGL